MLHHASCRNCRFHYKDGRYHAHCKIGLDPEEVLCKHGACAGWQERVFYNIGLPGENGGQMRISVRR